MRTGVTAGPSMTDEQAIRALVAAWMKATADGDPDRVLSLIAEDAVFLTPGAAPIRGRDAFAGLQRGAMSQVRIEPAIEIEEVMVHGEWAHAWSRLTLTITPRAGGSPMRRSGHALTIFHRQSDGTWVLARDANTLAPER